MIAIIRRRAGRWALNGAATVALAYILTPLTFVTWLAFFRQEIPSFPPEGYSLRWFASILDQPKFVDGFRTSFQVGVLATAIGLALGVPAALAVVRYRFFLRLPLSNLLLMPLIVPGVVLGTAMYVFQVEAENGLDVAARPELLPERRPRHALLLLGAERLHHRNVVELPGAVLAAVVHYDNLMRDVTEAQFEVKMLDGRDHAAFLVAGRDHNREQRKRARLPSPGRQMAWTSASFSTRL